MCSGNILRRYIHGPGVDEYLTMYSYDAGTGAVDDIQYYHADHLGSIIAMTDAATGNVDDTYSYGAYGETSDPTGNPFRYTGRRIDAETGFYYYRARYYAPALGRFLQVDPIGYGDNMNVYAYVGNDPVNAIDPTGEFLNFVIGALIGAAVDTAIQLASTCSSSGGCSVDLKQVGVAAAFGAISSGTSALAASVTRSALQRVGLESVIEAGLGVANAETTRAVTGEQEVSAGEQVKEDSIAGAGGGAFTAVGNAVEGNEGVSNKTVLRNSSQRPSKVSVVKAIISGVITGVIGNGAQEAADVCGEVGEGSSCSGNN